jgi:nucleoid-associated protein YgaU
MPPEGSVGKQTQQTLEDAKETAAKLNAAYREMAQERERRSERPGGSDSRLKQLQGEANAAQVLAARLSSAKDVYTVKPGDTLSAIAAALCGDRTLWPAILRANAHLLGNADAIYPVKVLVIP